MCQFLAKKIKGQALGAGWIAQFSGRVYTNGSARPTFSCYYCFTLRPERTWLGYVTR